MLQLKNITKDYTAADTTVSALKGISLSFRENEFVDVRIVFPNGEDYLVTGRKRVYRMIRDEEGETQAIQMRFREEELLRYQAARIDTMNYRDCVLYAVPYVGEFQQAAEVYYPVNQAVFRLLQGKRGSNESGEEETYE